MSSWWRRGKGIKLVGPAHASQAFPAGMTPAQQSVGQLEAQAVWRRKTSIGKCRSSGDTAADVELWEQSLAEAEAGWIDGPFYDECEVSERVKTTDWICARRFPLQQPTKIRLIDDGLESGLNSAYSCYNKLTLMDMDAVVALANTVLQAFASNGVFRFSLFTGEFLTGKIHGGWNSDSTLLGRTLDLKAAYKQLAVNPSQGFVRVMVEYDPVKSRPALFMFNALPFGATDSRAFMEFVLDALGWRFASKGKKAEPPLPSFKVLGVVMDMSQSSVGKLVVSTKPERVDDLVQSMCEILGTRVIFLDRRLLHCMVS